MNEVSLSSIFLSSLPHIPSPHRVPCCPLLTWTSSLYWIRSCKFAQPIEVGKTVSAALGTIEKALAKNKERQVTVTDLCAKEIEETKKWVAAGSVRSSLDSVIWSFVAPCPVAILGPP